MKKFNLVNLIPTFFYVGFLPKMPGTWGSIAAFVVFLIPNTYFFYSIIIFTIISLLISIPLINKIEGKYGNDPSFVVIDEVLAMWVIFMFDFIANSWILLILSFITFRFFDILKPLYINKLNNRNGAIFVILDDLIAAIYTITLMFFLNYFFKF